jgi:predicted Zn-dependent peptidase
VQQDLITAAELRRVQIQVVNRFTFGSERPSDRARLYAYYQTLLGDYQAGVRYPQAIQALTLEDIQQAAQRYLSPDAYGIVRITPAAAP